MLHIKDIEAFAHINEALARDSGVTRQGTDADGHHPPMHPALLVAMAATGRLKPEEDDGRKHHPASLSGMMARLMGARGR
ncbi:hypothetical protein [Azospirillum rugosum]|uniref:Uncharacterized protein n=1 Tax=Azospirillum rugosum TaxID=416170 RepID=A0ABS4SIR2_9PROT|nr:hypothetical protein [Azospirillum rugosum]MBP2292370.1 hypothetical protein [Azospirillum rugosum]MDQ0526129.1 hypothetical protein [Azospirillum rugosum]